MARFHLIFAASGTFQHLLTCPDQAACLARVREHLAPDGCLAFDILFPHADLLSDTEDHAWFSYVGARGRTIHVSGNESYAPVHQIKHETAYRRWHDASGKENMQRARLALRYVFAQELEALLHHNGFTITECYGNWDPTPLSSQSQRMIYVCRTRCAR